MQILGLRHRVSKFFLTILETNTIWHSTIKSTSTYILCSQGSVLLGNRTKWELVLIKYVELIFRKAVIRKKSAKNCIIPVHLYN